MTKGYYCGKKDMELIIDVLKLRVNHLTDYLRNNGRYLSGPDLTLTQQVWAKSRNLLDRMTKRYNHLYPSIPNCIPGE